MVSGIEDSPYPPQVTVKGALKGSVLTVSGATGGMRPGARITVYVKDLTKKKSRFVRQAVQATTTATGGYRWKGKAPASRVKVYTLANGAKSPVIQIGRTS